MLSGVRIIAIYHEPPEEQSSVVLSPSVDTDVSPALFPPRTPSSVLPYGRGCGRAGPAQWKGSLTRNPLVYY